MHTSCAIIEREIHMSDQQSETVEAVVEDGSQAEAASTEQAVAADPLDGYVSQDDFKKMQSILDKRAAEADQRAKIASRKLQELELKGVPEEEREVVALRQAIEQRDAELMQFKKETALRSLSDQYGVPFDAIKNVNTPEEAYGIALQFMKDQIAGSGQVAQATPAAPPQAQTPFVTPVQAGGNRARDWDAEFKAAVDAKDSQLYARLLREQKSA